MLKKWTSPGSLAALALFGGAVVGAAALGGRATRRRLHGLWYRNLSKPRLQPPASVFGPVWAGLYTLSALSGWRVFRAPPSTERTRALVLWGLQLALNAAWSPLFFKRRRPDLALVDCAGLTAALVAYASVAYKVDRPAALMVAPYLGWSGFATVLNEEIVRKNQLYPKLLAN